MTLSSVICQSTCLGKQLSRSFNSARTFLRVICLIPDQKSSVVQEKGSDMHRSVFVMVNSRRASILSRRRGLSGNPRVVLRLLASNLVGEVLHLPFTSTRLFTLFLSNSVTNLPSTTACSNQLRYQLGEQRYKQIRPWISAFQR